MIKVGKYEVPEAKLEALLDLVVEMASLTGDDINQEAIDGYADWKIPDAAKAAGIWDGEYDNDEDDDDEDDD